MDLFQEQNGENKAVQKKRKSKSGIYTFMKEKEGNEREKNAPLNTSTKNNDLTRMQKTRRELNIREMEAIAEEETGVLLF